MLNLSEIPDAITFQRAIAITQTLMDQLEQGQLPRTELGKLVAKLVSTRDGARGFFVAYLSDPRTFYDETSPELLHALQSSPEVVPELLIKNLAMSTSMEMTHRRNGNPDLAEQSAQVNRRTATILLHLTTDAPIMAEAQALWQGLTTHTGSYAAFFEKWGYDAEQQQAIATRLQEVFPQFETPQSV